MSLSLDEGKSSKPILFASGYLNTEVAGARVANEHLLWDEV